MMKRSDLTGKRFGKRTVLAIAEDVKGKHTRWTFRCDCGYESTCLTQDLRRNGPCLMCGHKGPRPYRRLRPFEAKYNTLVNRARHSVLITYEEFLEFTKVNDCHYCGENIPWSEYQTKVRSTAVYLDRKDSALAYEVGNLVVCCTRCNYAKNRLFTYEQWVEIGKLIRSWKRKTCPPPKEISQSGNQRR
jgi:hypothetical protein